MEIKKVKIQEWFENIGKYLTNREEHLCYAVQNQTEITYGLEGDCDTEWCEQNNVPAYNIQSSGGCIVHPKGNVSVGMVYSANKHNGFVLAQIIRDFADYLKQKGLSVEMLGNDVMVDNFKVASAAEFQYDVENQWCYGILQISINQDLEVIEHACKKPMVKIPKGLSEWGITTEEIKNWLLKTVSKL